VTQWETIVANFEAVMSGTIPGIDENDLVEVDGIIDMENYPESIHGIGYSLQLIGLPRVNSEINGINYTTFRVRMQLGFTCPDRPSYYVAIERLESIIRQRYRMSTWNGTFHLLEHINTPLMPMQKDSWNFVADSEWDVTMQGS
jgi:hypothetical protein